MTDTAIPDASTIHDASTSTFDESTLQGPRTGVIPDLIWAFRINEAGVATALPVDQPIEHTHQSWVWLHLDLGSVATLRWLEKTGLPPASVAMMLSEDQHQQLHVASSCVYGTLADLVLEGQGIGKEVGYLRFIMTDRFLVTGRHHSLCAVESAKAILESGGVRLTNCAALLELIVEHLADTIDTVAEDLETKLDEIEDQLVDRSIGAARRNLAGVRRSSVRLHRQLSGLRAVLSRIERQGMTAVDPRLQLRAGRLAQRLEELDHAVLEIRERGYRLQEEVSATITEETNRHLHLLSILTSLLLPPTLVAGVFGMNTKGLPLEDSDWGFVWAMILVLGSSILAYVLLRVIGVLKPRE
jgi:zinc transporter